MSLSGLVVAFCFLMVGCACLYYVLVVVAALKFHRTPEPSPDFTPPVSVFKPLDGLERDLYEILAGFCRQDYPEYEVLFAVGDPSDPAIEVVEQLRRDFPGVPIRLLVADRRYGTNRKVDSLEKMYREMQYSFLAISDSDMRVDPDYLRRVMAPLRDPHIGLVTCFYRCEPGGTLASTFEAIGTCGEFHPSAMVARLLEGVKFAFGSTMATRKELVEAIGGFPMMADYQSDDYETGNRMAALGREVVFSHYVVHTLLPADGWRTMIQHQFRWVCGAAHSRPKGHAGLIFTYGLPFVLLALAIAPHSRAVWLLAATWLLLRLLAAWTAGVYVLGDPTLRRNLLLVPARDLLSFGLWAASFFSNRITWRGRQYRVEKGKMIPLEE